MNTDYKSIQEIIACPRCKETVRIENDTVFCKNPDCALHQTAFINNSGTPVLVDFESSILDSNSFSEREFLSDISRNETFPFKFLLRRILFGENKSARKNEPLFLDELLNLSERPRCLVIGGANIGSGMRNLYEHASITTIGLDIYYSERVTLVADAHDIPLLSDSIDGVWIQAVLEHVLDPSRVVQEIQRVLKAGGIVYSETPFMQQVHEQAYDFTRFTHSGHRWLFKHFKEIDSGIVGGAGTQLLWTIEHFVASLTRSRIAGKLAKMLFFPVRFFDRLCDPVLSMNTASSFFFYGRKSSSVLKPGDIINYYRKSR
jgi:SAM-dependent methyltransferase